MLSSLCGLVCGGMPLSWHLLRAGGLGSGPGRGWPSTSCPAGPRPLAQVALPSVPSAGHWSCPHWPARLTGHAGALALDPPHTPHPPWPKCTGLNSTRLWKGLWLCVLTGLSAPPAAVPGWSQEVGLDASFPWASCIKPATKSHAAHLLDGPQPHGHHPGWASSPPLHTAPGFSPRVTLPRCPATPAGAPDAPTALRLRPCSGALCVSLSAFPLSRAWHFSVRLPALPSNVLPLPTAPVHPLDLSEAVTASMPSP